MAFSIEELTISLVRIDELNAAVVLKHDGQNYEYKFSSCRDTQKQCPFIQGPAEMYGAGTVDTTLEELKRALEYALAKLNEIESEDLASRRSRTSGKQEGGAKGL